MLRFADASRVRAVRESGTVRAWSLRVGDDACVSVESWGSVRVCSLSVGDGACVFVERVCARHVRGVSERDFFFSSLPKGDELTGFLFFLLSAAKGWPTRHVFFFFFTRNVYYQI